MQAAVRYEHPKDNLHTGLHYRMFRVRPGRHIAHCGIELPLQSQEQSASVNQEVMRDAVVVQKFLNVMSCFPLL